MDINSIFWVNIPPIDSTLLFITFIVLLGILIVLCAYFIKKYWEQIPTGMYGRGTAIGALIIAPIILIGLFYLTAESTLPYNQPESKVPGLEVVGSTATVETFSYDYFIIKVTIKNTGNSTINSMNYDVHATGYDSTGNPVTNVIEFPESLMPGQTTNFNITINGKHGQVVRYKLVISPIPNNQ